MWERIEIRNANSEHWTMTKHNTKYTSNLLIVTQNNNNNNEKETRIDVIYGSIFEQLELNWIKTKSRFNLNFSSYYRAWMLACNDIDPHLFCCLILYAKQIETNRNETKQSNPLVRAFTFGQKVHRLRKWLNGIYAETNNVGMLPKLHFMCNKYKHHRPNIRQMFSCYTCRT